MRYIPPAFQAHLNGTELTLAMCLKMTRRDGVVLGFTAHDQDLTVSGITYRAAVGFTCSALRWTARIEDQRTTIEGLLSELTGGITEADARLGLYSEALCELFLVNWSDLSMGVVPLKRGRLASMVPQGGGYSAEIRSLFAPLLRIPIVEPVRAACSASLGDARCTKTAALFEGVVTGPLSASQFEATSFIGPALDSDLTGGFFQFTDGSFPWFRNGIKSWDSGSQVMTFARPFPAVPQAGWSFRAYEGCDKKFSTCRDRFHNAVNFRGFPHVPDRDKIYKRAILVNGGYPV